MKELFSFCICLLTSNVLAEVNDRFYPRFHFASQGGSLVGPSGICEYNREYHIFYEFFPNSSLIPGTLHWGHAKSSDLFNWEYLPVALRAEQDYETNGALSGSVYVEDDTMYLYYTGNYLSPRALLRNESIENIQRQQQALAISTNGENFFKYDRNPIIKGDGLQPDIRNPNVWKNGNTYYMVLGNSFNNRTQGRILLYTSKDKHEWQEASVLYSGTGSLGNVWEDPDFFEIRRGKYILLFSPQEVEVDGGNSTESKSGYIIGNFDYNTLVFEPLTDFTLLDFGHDFTAAKTFESRRGRRILIGWLDSRGSVYPEKIDGWFGMISLPRELSLTRDNVLLQTPVSEASDISSTTLYRGKNREYEAVRLPNKAGEINIRARSNKSLRVLIESNNFIDRVTINYDNKRGTISIRRGGIGSERTAPWKPSGKRYNLRIFVDASSIEIFCGDGEVTLSSRFFPKGDILVRIPFSLSSLFNVRRFTVNAIDRTVPAVNPKQIPQIS